MGKIYLYGIKYYYVLGVRENGKNCICVDCKEICIIFCLKLVKIMFFSLDDVSKIWWILWKEVIVKLAVFIT